MDRDYHVVPSGDNWIVRLENSSQASSKHIKKKRAIEKAKDLAEKRGVQVQIHNKTGMISRTIGNSF